MNDDRLGGIALIAGAIGGIVTMVLHPTGHDLLTPERFASVAPLAVGVHALAIASLPFSFLGALALSRRTASPDRLALAALVVYGFALVSVMVAAAVSGFAGTGVAREFVSAAPSEKEGWRILIHYTGELNQAFARIFAVASATAIMLWSASIVRTRALARGVAVYGLLLGPAAIVAVLSGLVKLDAPGFGLVVFTQAIWFLIAGALTRQSRTGASPHVQTT
jgi:hypothetical protein